MNWLLRVLGWVLAIALVLATLVWLNFDDVRYNAIVWVATPGKPFAEPPTFDYATPDLAAYPLIWWMKKDQFAKDAPDIAVCSEPTQTGCVVTFNPVGPNLRTGLNPIFDQTGIICVNPLTWRTDGAYAGFELNLGAQRFSEPGKLIPGAADAKCDENGRLVVSEIRADMYAGIPLQRQLVMGVFGRDNHHSIAGGLFYANIRKNVKDRVDAYLAQNPVN